MTSIRNRIKGLQSIRAGDLRPNPRNWRTHPAPQQAALQAVLEEVGIAGALIARETADGFELIDGHLRADGDPDQEWPVLVLDVDAAEADKLLATLDPLAAMAGADAGVLDDLLKSIETDSDELQKMLDDLAKDNPLPTPEIVEDEVPEPPAEPITQPGDLWLLGEHRLLCGDSTNAEDVELVMDGEKAELFQTDPPYLVDYTGSRIFDGKEKGKDWSDTYREIDIKDAEGFFRSTFTNGLSVIAPHTAIYCWHAHKRCGLIQTIWKELGILDHQQIVWVKPAQVFGYSMWSFRHEPCLMGWVEGSKPSHDGSQSETSVWELTFDNGGAKPSGNEHPTQKPLEIFARPMRKHTKPGALCYEPFCGSGSQLIAAEQLGRRCYGLEISPAYCDVVVQRWENLTGKTATRQALEAIA